MDIAYKVPEEFRDSFLRLVPYMSAALRNDPPALEAILLYLKLGGEKLARIGIEAYHQTQRLNDAEALKQEREKALLAEQRDNTEEEEEEEEEEENGEDSSESNNDEDETGY